MKQERKFEVKTQKTVFFGCPRCGGHVDIKTGGSYVPGDYSKLKIPEEIEKIKDVRIRFLDLISFQLGKKYNRESKEYQRELDRIHLQEKRTLKRETRMVCANCKLDTTLEKAKKVKMTPLVKFYMKNLKTSSSYKSLINPPKHQVFRTCGAYASASVKWVITKNIIKYLYEHRKSNNWMSYEELFSPLKNKLDIQLAKNKIDEKMMFNKNIVDAYHFFLIDYKNKRIKFKENPDFDYGFN